MPKFFKVFSKLLIEISLRFTHYFLFHFFDLGYVWFVHGLCFYGISLASDDLGGDMYLNFQLGNLIQIPSCFVGIIAFTYIGRKKTTMVHVLILAVSAYIIAFTPNKGNVKWVRVLFGMLGRYGIFLGFIAIYTWSAEIFPTHIRSTGMGFCQVMARVGAICSPWVAKGLKVVHPTAPFNVLGIVALFSVVLMVWLPETKDMNDDVINRDDITNNDIINHDVIGDDVSKGDGPSIDMNVTQNNRDH